MNEIPNELKTHFDAAFDVLHPDLRAALAPQGVILYRHVWKRFLCHRTHKDNRIEHELVVLKHFFHIAQRLIKDGGSLGCTSNLSGLRIGMATALYHDNFLFPKRTEAHILAARTAEEREAHIREKDLQRRAHMREGASNTKLSLAELSQSGHAILTDDETRDCVGLVGLHDIWKLNWPWPMSNQPLAVCFVEADALWPVSHPLGPLADLQRDHGPDYQPSLDELRTQAQVNLDTQLRQYRSSFEATTEKFQDGTTIIRTTGGAQLLADYVRLWNLK